MTLELLHRATFVALLSSALCSSVMIGGCNVAPDIVGRATDGGLGLTDDDAGETPDCETGSRLAPVPSQNDCEFEVPRPFPPDFDPRRINVNVFEGDRIVPYAGGLFSIDECERVLHGWYWIDPGEYTRMGFCPQTCALAGQWQALALQFGCDTITPPWLPGPQR